MPLWGKRYTGDGRGGRVVLTLITLVWGVQFLSKVVQWGAQHGGKDTAPTVGPDGAK